MKSFLLCSGLNLHAGALDDPMEYIAQGLALHKRVGMEAADFPMGKLLDAMGENWQPAIEASKDLADREGIPFRLCHLPFGVKLGDPEEKVANMSRRIHKAIDAARLLGVDFAVLHPNTTTVPLSEFDPVAHYDGVMAHLAPFAEHAEKAGVRLCVENMRLVHESYPIHRYCGTPEELCTIADALGIGVCWDTGHAHINGLKQSEALAYVGKRLKMLHINDNFGGDDIHLAPFMGSADWADIMLGLQNIDYRGLLNFEVGTGRIPTDCRESFARYLAATGDQLRRMLTAP